ncbi:unnamed protein product [Lathyrus oleraceus]
MFISDKRVISKGDSIWWRDLIMVDINSKEKHYCFSYFIKYRLNEGRRISFWHINWLGNQSLIDVFPKIYVATTDPFTSVTDARGLNGGSWCWNFQDIVINHNVIGRLQLEEVNYMLSNAELVQDVEDEFDWTFEANEVFYVKSCCKILISRSIDGLPTRDQLVRRGIVVDDRDNNCAFCFKEEESNIHLYDMCEVTGRIWAKVGNRLGNNLTLSIEELSSFILNCHKVTEKDEETLFVWFG